MDGPHELKDANACVIEQQFQNMSLEDVQSRHRKERKDLQGKIQALKKATCHLDKRKRKEVIEEVQRLEKELIKKHTEEINEYEQIEKTKEKINSENANDATQQQRVTKAQKRRDKKAKEAREREHRVQAGLTQMLNGPKAIEGSNLEAKLKERQLSLYHIESDGDCLYNAVRHQLIQQGLGNYTAAELRSITADYIEKNKATLIPYMTNPETNNLLSDAEFSKYCNDIRNTSIWGGQIELKALSSTLKIPIEVIQAEGTSTLQGKEYSCLPLVITYHRHMYSMGEHYNSTIPHSDMMDINKDSD